MAYCYKNILIIERKNISNIDFIDNLFNKFNLSFDNNIPFEYKNQEDKFLFYFNSNFFDNDEFNLVNVIMLENVIGYIKCIVDINNIKFERMDFDSNESFKNNLIVTKKYLSKTIKDIENIDEFHKTKYTLHWDINVINKQSLFNIIKEVDLINNEDNTYTFVLNDVYPSYVAPINSNNLTPATTNSFNPEPATTFKSTTNTTPSTTFNNTTNTTPSTTFNNTTSTTPTTTFNSTTPTPATTFKPTSSGIFSSSLSTPTTSFKPASSGMFGSSSPAITNSFKPTSSSIFGSTTPSIGFKPTSSSIFGSTTPSSAGFKPANVSTSFFTPSTKFGVNK